MLKEGEILESKFVVKRRNRTIHKRMREYLTAISRDPRLRTVLMETGDGAALSVRRRDAEEQEGEALSVRRRDTEEQDSAALSVRRRDAEEQ